MSAGKKPTRKFYVVWVGRTPGVYDTWADCKAEVDGVEGAKYKAFGTRELAEEAYNSPYYAYIHQKRSGGGSGGGSDNRSGKKASHVAGAEKPQLPALAVDAACSGNPGRMEYRGVYVREDGTSVEMFHLGPMEDATNNVGEFLALVHGLALLKSKGRENLPLYSDSKIAQGWVRQGVCKTKLERTSRNGGVFDLIARAERWIESNRPITADIRKWQTEAWGEIPADFGRK